MRKLLLHFKKFVFVKIKVINSGDVDPPFRFMLTHLLAGNNCKN